MNDYYNVKFLSTTRKVHKEDFNKNSLDKLIKTVSEKTPAVWTITSDDKYKHAVVSTIIGDTARIKFVYDLLGNLYHDDPWAVTPEFSISPNKIKLITYGDL